MTCWNWSVLYGSMVCTLACLSEPESQARVDEHDASTHEGTLARSASTPPSEPREPPQPAPTQLGFLYAQRLAHVPDDPEASFGRSLSAYRDRLAVGAPNTAEPGTARVFVYAREGDAWLEDAVLAPPDDEAAGFGAAVALHHDILVVGAPQADASNQNRVGVAYIYARESAGWTLRGALEPPAPQPWQGFGGQVTVAYDRIVVGSVDRDYGALEDAGAAYVYEREGELFHLTAELHAPNPRAHDKFGHALAILDTRVAISALRRDVDGRVDAGAVYAFERGKDGYTLAQVITAPVAQEDEQFGRSLSLSYVSGFAQRLVVGAPHTTIGALEQAGAAYVFEAGERGDFVARATVFDVDPAAHAGFGEHVAQTRGVLLVGSRAKGRAPKALQMTAEGASFVSNAALPLPGNEPCADMTGPLALTSEHAFVGARPSEADSEPIFTSAVQVFRLAEAR